MVFCCHKICLDNFNITELMIPFFCMNELMIGFFFFIKFLYVFGVQPIVNASNLLYYFVINFYKLSFWIM